MYIYSRPSAARPWARADPAPPSRVPKWSISAWSQNGRIGIIFQKRPCGKRSFWDFQKLDSKNEKQISHVSTLRLKQVSYKCP